MRLYSVIVFLVAAILSLTACQKRSCLVTDRANPSASCGVPPDAAPPGLVSRLTCTHRAGAVGFTYRLDLFDDGSYGGFAAASDGASGTIQPIDQLKEATVDYQGLTYIFTNSSGTIAISGDLSYTFLPSDCR